MKYNTFLFDFDGTLVDSMPSFVSVMLGILDEEKIEYTDDIVKIITPLGYLGSARYFRQLGVKKSEEELVAFMNERAQELYLYKIQAKNNVKDVLLELKKRGASLNVLTASPHKVLDPCLKRLGLYDLFENVWSCDDFSTTKSDPEIYKKASAIIGVPVEDVLFLDDNFLADKTAKEAGMRVCGVFDEYSRDYIKDIKEVSDHYVYDFSELLEL